MSDHARTTDDAPEAEVQAAEMAHDDPAPEPPTPPDPPAEDEPPAAGSRRTWFRRRARDGDDPEASQATGVIPMPPDPDQPTGAIAMPARTEVGDDGPAPSAVRLRRQRKSLMRDREDMIFHLGGLTFELYRHGRLGEPVARHRAGMVAELDDAVRAIDDQLLAIQETRGKVIVQGPAEAGACLACRAPFYADARFCMHCGVRFASVPAAGADDARRTGSAPAEGDA